MAVLVALLLTLSILPSATTNVKASSTYTYNPAAPPSNTTYKGTATNKVTLKKQLYAGLKNYHSTIQITYKVNGEKAIEEAKAAIAEIKKEDPYLGGTLYMQTWQAYRNVLTINARYLTTKKQEAYVTAQIPKIKKQIIKAGMSDFEKVKAINEYIANRTQYSYQTKASPHAVYAILKENKGVCQAYALLAYRLLKASGLDVRYVTGFTKEAHAWNLVKVDGKWYNLDVTYNDSDVTFNNIKFKIVKYDHFLLSDKVIGKTHKRDAESKKLPKATSVRFDIFAKTYPGAINVGITPELLQMQGNEMFWLEGSNIHSMNIYRANVKAERLIKTKFTDLKGKKIIVANGSLFVSEDFSGGLKRIDLKTKKITTVLDYYVTDITIKNGYFLAYAGKDVVFKEKIIKK